MPMPRIWSSALLLSLSFSAACDNVGRAFDNPDGGGPPVVEGESLVQVVPDGGDIREGRPKVRLTAPAGAGWPGVVPIVVEFTESVNEASILPTSANGTDGRVVLRVKGATQVLPCQYSFLAAGRLLVLRPISELSNQQNPTYEVVLLPDARDADGVRFDVPSGGTVLSEFQVNQDASFVDGRILAVYPRDNQRDASRESEVVVVFDRPANAASITSANLFVRPDGGAPLPGDLDLPLQTVGFDDPRVARFRPATPFSAAASLELVVTESITFGTEGNLDFRGRTPFARFETVAPAAPTAVALQNPVAGFPNKINRGNLTDVTLQVTTPTDTEPGDRVRVRIYGGDAATAVTADLAFVERTAQVAGGGAQTVSVSFATALGSLSRAKFDDGPLTFAAQMLRGSQSSGFLGTDSDAADAPMFDITPPELVRAGPPGTTDGTTLFSDLDQVAFYGVASEALAAAELTQQNTGSPAVATMFACDDAGRFVMRPLDVGRPTAPVPYLLTLVDRAGNGTAAGVPVNIRTRGFLTGVLTDTLTVEVYDQTTLQPIAGATVLVDVGVVTAPATTQLPPGTTGSDGRVAFGGRTAGTEHTVTIVRAGYDLLTIAATRAAFVSVPLRPVSNATATLEGNVAFAPAPNTTALVSSSAADDQSPLGVRTANASPNTIPDLPIVPNRPQVLTAFSGVFEPTAAPTFTSQGCLLGGATLLEPTPPAAPVEAGARSRQTVSLVPTVGTGLAALLAPELVDFVTATDLDLGNLTGGSPIARVTLSLQGFQGQVLVGIGYVQSVTGTTYTINANYGVLVATALAPFTPGVPSAWLVTEARDVAGRISRTRSFLFLTTGNLVAAQPAPAIPTIAAATATAPGAPSVTFQDVLDRAPVQFGIGVNEITARDPAGRRWTVLADDSDATGGTSAVQFPDLATANVAGLAPGNWTLQVESRICTRTDAFPDDWNLTERVRQEVTYSRSSAVTVTVP
jgi:hypothetical protein